MTEQILGVSGAQNTGGNRQKAVLFRPPPLPHIPLSHSHRPLAELGQAKSLSPPDSLVQSHGQVLRSNRRTNVDWGRKEGLGVRKTTW